MARKNFGPRPGAAWTALVELTLLSLGMVTGLPPRGWTAFAVATIAWIKGDLVARHFLESHRAGPLFARIVRIFVALAPIGLMATTLIEHATAP